VPDLFRGASADDKDGRPFDCASLKRQPILRRRDILTSQRNERIRVCDPYGVLRLRVRAFGRERISGGPAVRVMQR
jgi:hypothetical protein